MSWKKRSTRKRQQTQKQEWWDSIRMSSIKAYHKTRAKWKRRKNKNKKSSRKLIQEIKLLIHLNNLSKSKKKKINKMRFRNKINIMMMIHLELKSKRISKKRIRINMKMKFNQRNQRVEVEVGVKKELDKLSNRPLKKRRVRQNLRKIK